VLHALVEINALVELAAPFADERQPHAVEEAETTAQVSGRFVPREVWRWQHGGRRDLGRNASNPT
jgi:hypothetical protein